MRIRIEGSDLPGSSCGPGPDAPKGHRNSHVAVQGRKRDDLLNLVPADADTACWTLDRTTTAAPNGVDCRGPHISGPLGGRFVYLSWGTVDGAQRFTKFRRAKLLLEAVPPAVLGRASDLGVLVGRLGLTDAKGNPLCASVRPPAIEWWAAAA